MVVWSRTRGGWDYRSWLAGIPLGTDGTGGVAILTSAIVKVIRPSAGEPVQVEAGETHQVCLVGWTEESFTVPVDHGESRVVTFESCASREWDELDLVALYA